ncbi:MAG TPA: tRNA pseudouridine(13) synthase TruD [Phycisphaerales bacterium]|nr:tRNA pseudouridine(13) synthase TruD [Phycisphaerales bacterium]
MTIRRVPEDFRVVERLAPGVVRERPDKHAVFTLTKRSLATPEAVAKLAEALGVRAGDVAYCGLKDKHALTTQHVSVPAAAAGKTIEPQPGWSAGRVGFSPGPLAAADIEANEFTIVVRGLTLDASERIDRHARMLDAGEGSLAFVNYFGEQRFGSARHGGGFVARRLIEGDFEGALRLAIATPARKDTGAKRAFTRGAASGWGDWTRLAAELPRHPHRRAVEHLAAEPGDFKGAFALLPNFEQQMFVDAYQSHLWNLTAAALVRSLDAPAFETGGERGALAFVPASALVPALRGIEVPVPRPGMRFGGPWGEHARAVLAAEGLDADRLTIPGLRRPSFGGDTRPLVASARGFSITEPAPDGFSPRHAARTLRFALGRGSYATVLLRALGQ